MLIRKRNRANPRRCASPSAGAQLPPRTRYLRYSLLRLSRCNEPRWRDGNRERRSFHLGECSRVPNGKTCNVICALISHVNKAAGGEHKPRNVTPGQKRGAAHLRQSARITDGITRQSVVA